MLNLFLWKVVSQDVFEEYFGNQSQLGRRRFDNPDLQKCLGIMKTQFVYKKTYLVVIREGGKIKEKAG